MCAKFILGFVAVDGTTSGHVTKATSSVTAHQHSKRACDSRNTTSYNYTDQPSTCIPCITFVYPFCCTLYSGASHKECLTQQTLHTTNFLLPYFMIHTTNFTSHNEVTRASTIVADVSHPPAQALQSLVTALNLRTYHSSRHFKLNSIFFYIMGSKRSRKVISVEMKQEIIRRSECGVKQYDLVKEFGLSKTTILTNKDAIKSAKVAKRVSKLFNEKHRSSIHEELEKLLAI